MGSVDAEVCFTLTYGRRELSKELPFKKRSKLIKILVRRLFLCLRSAPQASPSFLFLSFSLSLSLSLYRSPFLFPRPVARPGLDLRGGRRRCERRCFAACSACLFDWPNDAPEIPACLAQDTPVFCEESAIYRVPKRHQQRPEGQLKQALQDDSSARRGGVPLRYTSAGEVEAQY